MHTGRPLTQSNYTRSCIIIQLSSWGWAQCCSKHVGDSNKRIIEEIVRQVGHLPDLYEDALLDKYKIYSVKWSNILKKSKYITSLLWNFIQRRMAVPCLRFGTTYLFHLLLDTLSRNIGDKLPFYAVWNPRGAQVSFTRRQKPEITQSTSFLKMQALYDELSNK